MAKWRAFFWLDKPAPDVAKLMTRLWRPETQKGRPGIWFGRPATKVLEAANQLAKAPTRPLRALNEWAPLANRFALPVVELAPSQLRSPPSPTGSRKVRTEVEGAFFVLHGRLGLSRNAAPEGAKPANRLGFAGFSFARRHFTTRFYAAPLHCGRSANRCRTRAISCRLGRLRKGASRLGRVECPPGDPTSSRPI